MAAEGSVSGIGPEPSPRRPLPREAYPILGVGFLFVTIALVFGFADSVSVGMTADYLPFMAVFGLTGWALVIAAQVIFRRKPGQAVKIRSKTK